MSSCFDYGKRRKRSSKWSGHFLSSAVSSLGISRTAGRSSSNTIQRVSFGGIGCILKSRSNVERYCGTSIASHAHTIPWISFNGVQLVFEIKDEGFDRRQLPASTIPCGCDILRCGFFLWQVFRWEWTWTISMIWCKHCEVSPKKVGSLGAMQVVMQNKFDVELWFFLRVRWDIVSELHRASRQRTCYLELLPLHQLKADTDWLLVRNLESKTFPI